MLLVFMTLPVAIEVLVLLPDAHSSREVKQLRFPIHHAEEGPCHVTHDRRTVNQLSIYLSIYLSISLSLDARLPNHLTVCHEGCSARDRTLPVQVVC